MGSSGGEKPLPPGAVRIEYLGVPRTGYFKIPIHASSSCVVEVDFEYNATSFGQFCIFGGGDGNLNREMSIISGDTVSAGWIYRCGNKQNTRLLNPGVYQRHIIKWSFQNVTIDGVEYPQRLSASEFIASNDVVGLCRNLRTGYNVFPFEGNIYYAQFKDDNVTISLIPIRIEQEGYLFDKVSGRLFGNEGTGSFILGPDKT
jgi:hypothetical protein